MSNKPVCRYCCYSLLLLLFATSAVATLPVAGDLAVAARVLKLTVSDWQLILLKLCMSVTVCVYC